MYTVYTNLSGRVPLSPYASRSVSPSVLNFSLTPPTPPTSTYPKGSGWGSPVTLRVQSITEPVTSGAFLRFYNVQVGLYLYDRLCKLVYYCLYIIYIYIYIYILCY